MTDAPAQSSGRVAALCRAGLVALLLSLTPTSAQAEGEAGDASADAPRAELRIRGLGLLGNRAARRFCLRLLDESKPPTAFRASFIEDAAVLLLNQLAEAGFLEADVRARVTLPDGSEIQAACEDGEPFQLPPELTATRVDFEIQRGRRYYYAALAIHGLEPRAARRAEDFFYPPGGVLHPAGERPYSPARLERSIKNLRQDWINRGHRRATVTLREVQLDHLTGAAQVVVDVAPGPQLRVRRLEVLVRDHAEGEPVITSQRAPNVPFTLAWEQDTLQALTRDELVLGFADATVTMAVRTEELVGEEVLLDLEATVIRGPRVRLGNVTYTGHEHTRDGLMRDKTRLDGPWLNRIEVDQARERLSRLGIFRSVYVEYPETTNALQDVRFTVQEGRRTEIRAIAGYGSYDLLFGGAELTEYNLVGIGHLARLYGLQSFKSTIGRLTYSVPEFLAQDVTGFASAKVLLREELTFERQELSAGAGVLKAFPRAGQQVGLRYSYEDLQADSVSETAPGPTDTRVGAVILDWSLERRRSPLRPRGGHHAFARVELADAALGGEVRYQRLEAGGSWHQPLSRSLFLHLGLWQGVVTDFSDADDEVPFNKRFFPGGANSVRGYQHGEASPVDARGNQLGAASSIVGNLELEKALTRAWSVVGFLDGVANARDMDQFPGDEFLASVGAGLRWNTPVGPVRLEYGYNLNPRPHDPPGTLHVSVGFPF